MNHIDLETKVINKIQVLRKVLPTVQREVDMIKRREEVKKKLYELLSRSKPHPTEKSAVVTELRRLTSTLKVVLTAWQRDNQHPLKVRGVDYLQMLLANY